MPKFEISTLLELIQRHRVSVAAVVPPLVLALAKNPAVADYDLSSRRIVLSGAAPLGKELEEALHMRVHKAVFGQIIWRMGSAQHLLLGICRNGKIRKHPYCWTFWNLRQR